MPNKQQISMTGNIKWVVAQPLIGGMPIGFQNAFGCPPAAIITAGFGNDNHYIKYLNETHNLNVPIINMETDYETFKSEEDEILYNKICKDIDVMMHVAVCAGLSMLNACNSDCSTKRRGDADNDQNQNMYNLTKLGMRMNAKVVCFENAPAAYTKSGEGVVDRLKEIAEGFNYTTQLFKTDTLWHGIPQSRKRTFIMFYRDTNPALFNFEHKDYVLLSDYLDLVNESMIHYNQNIVDDSKDAWYDFILDYSKTNTYMEAMKKIAPHKTTWTAQALTDYIGFEKAIEFFEKKFKETQDAKYTKAIRIANHCIAKIKDNKGYWDSSTYLANDGKFINAVISKNVHRCLHPTQERGLNIRELLHLMGMPHDFEMIEAKKNWNHISQNVPVKTATFIGSQIKLYLEHKLAISKTDFVKQDNIGGRTDVGSIEYLAEEW